jgi:RES domain-containing protein
MAASSTAQTTFWRIAKQTKDFRADDLSGGGAATVGGRWNSEGNPVVYASTSVSLCVLETLAHLGDDIACRNRFLVTIDIPTKLVANRQVLQPSNLPVTWVAEPPGMDTVKIGDDWLKRGETLLLFVPSVIVPEEYNLLINPKHKDAQFIKAKVVRPYVYDPRLK